MLSRILLVAAMAVPMFADDYDDDRRWRRNDGRYDQNDNDRSRRNRDYSYGNGNYGYGNAMDPIPATARASLQPDDERPAISRIAESCQRP